MRKSPPALLRDVLGVVWAVAMVDLIFLGLGALLAPHVGAGLAFAMFGGLAVVTTLLFALMIAANLAWIVVARWGERRARRKSTGAMNGAPTGWKR